MTTYKLTYFDMDGGRGESVRIAFHAAGLAFEDNRLSFPQFGERRGSLPFRCVPVLEIDGQEITQSNAMNRYVGALAGLYPQDPIQALFCDEVMGAVEDIVVRTVGTFGLQGEELKKAREELVEGWLSTFVRGIDKLLDRGGGQFFADGKLTVADIKVFVWVRTLRSGMLDHVPKDLVDRLAPGLAAHQDRVANDERIVAYYASRA